MHSWRISPGRREPAAGVAMGSKKSFPRRRSDMPAAFARTFLPPGWLRPPASAAGSQPLAQPDPVADARALAAPDRELRLGAGAVSGRLTCRLESGGIICGARVHPAIVTQSPRERMDEQFNHELNWQKT
jgi:hypothetical protein